MTLNLKTFILGPIENNTYLISDSEAREAVLIDPAVPSKKVLDYLEENQITLSQIWITHAHFDHIGGVEWFIKQGNGRVQAAIHKDAIDLWNIGGSARAFGFDFDAGSLPEKILSEGDVLFIGSHKFKVFHTPGHTPGHVTFYNAESSTAYCGDLIFYHSVGRTDLEISNNDQLIDSINNKILTLPEETRLYPGHGKPTTVLEEKRNNPFLK